jgi:hypothetical protein
MSDEYTQNVKRLMLDIENYLFSGPRTKGVSLGQIGISTDDPDHLIVEIEYGEVDLDIEPYAVTVIKVLYTFPASYLTEKPSTVLEFVQRSTDATLGITA